MKVAQLIKNLCTDETIVRVFGDSWDTKDCQCSTTAKSLHELLKVKNKKAKNIMNAEVVKFDFANELTITAKFNQDGGLKNDQQ